MEQSAIADVNFWCTDKALFSIRSPWLKATDEQKIHHDVEITGNGMAADTEAARELCGVQHLALVVSQHLPVSAQSLRWDTRAKDRHVALKIGLDECGAPTETILVAGGEEAVREAAAHP